MSSRGAPNNMLQIDLRRTPNTRRHRGQSFSRTKESPIVGPNRRARKQRQRRHRRRAQRARLQHQADAASAAGAAAALRGTQSEADIGSESEAGDSLSSSGSSNRTPTRSRSQSQSPSSRLERSKQEGTAGTSYSPSSSPTASLVGDFSQLVVQAGSQAAGTATPGQASAGQQPGSQPARAAKQNELQPATPAPFAGAGAGAGAGQDQPRQLTAATKAPGASTANANANANVSSSGSSNSNNARERAAALRISTALQPASGAANSPGNATATAAALCAAAAAAATPGSATAALATAKLYPYTPATPDQIAAATSAASAEANASANSDDGSGSGIPSLSRSRSGAGGARALTFESSPAPHGTPNSQEASPLPAAEPATPGAAAADGEAASWHASGLAGAAQCPPLELEEALEIIMEALFPDGLAPRNMTIDEDAPLETGDPFGYDDSDDDDNDEAADAAQLRHLLSIELPARLPGLLDPEAKAEDDGDTTMSTAPSTSPAKPGTSAASSSPSSAAMHSPHARPKRRTDSIAYADPIHSEAELWELFQAKILRKCAAKVRYDDPRVPSAQAKLCMRCFENLPMTRVGLCRALAEASFDYMELWLIERKSGQESSNTKREFMNCGDGRVLAELLQHFVNITVADCVAATPNLPLKHLNAMTAQVELLSMSLVNLCRARPVLDSDFELLVGSMQQLLSVREHVAVGLLRRLMAAWPTIDSTREVRWIMLLQPILLSVPAPVITASGMHRMVFRQLVRSLGSLHAAVARQALELLSNMYIMLHYVLPYPKLSQAVNSTLVANRGHWNSVVVEMSDAQFENMLDMA